MAQRISNPAIHHIDKDTGAPLSGGQLFFFEINSTTPKDTFSDQEGTIPNTNPVILDGSGVEPDIFGTGSFRIVLQNSNDVQQWERDPVNFEISGAQFSDWLATVDYAVNDVVKASDSDFYSSIQTPNLNQDPTISPNFWSRTDLLKRWNTNETYDSGDPVTFSEAMYISKTASNQGNQPDISLSNWEQTGIHFRGALIFATAALSQVLTSSIDPLDIFDTAKYDTDNIWSPTVNPTRLTVPTGVTKVKLITNIFITRSGVTTGSQGIFLIKNDDILQLDLPGTPSFFESFDDFGGDYTMNSGVQEVIGGDFFEVFGVANADGTITAVGGTGFVPSSMFAMEILE